MANPSKPKWPNLDTLVGGKEKFLSKYWPNKIYTKHGRIDRIQAILDHPDLQSVDSLCRAHKGRAKEGYISNKNNDWIVNRIDPLQGIKRFETGMSVVLEGIQESFPSLRKWVLKIGEELGITEYEISAHLTPKGNNFPHHFDGHEILIFQTKGTKKWIVSPQETIPWPNLSYVPSFYDPSYRPTPLAQQFTIPVDMENSKTVRLRPGSFMFLPRGMWHTTEALTDSISFTISFYNPTWANLLCTDILEQIDAWREPATGCNSRNKNIQGASKHKYEAMLSLLADQIRDRTLSQLYLKNLTITSSTRFRLNPRASFHLSKEETNEWVLDISGVEDDFSIQIENKWIPLVKWILRQSKPFRISQANKEIRIPPKVTRYVFQSFSKINLIVNCES